MPEVIRDGTGNGYLAMVDSENHLHVSSVMENMIGHRSHWDATAFGGGTPLLTITTTGGHMLYLKNTSSTHNFVISDMWFSWNGGSTSGTDCMIGALYFGVGAPSAENTASALGVLNRNSGNTPDVTVEYWDETGAGLTCAGGTAAFHWINAKGHTHVDVKSAVILGINDTMAINLKGENETGEGGVNIYGFTSPR